MDKHHGQRDVHEAGMFYVWLANLVLQKYFKLMKLQVLIQRAEHGFIGVIHGCNQTFNLAELVSTTTTAIDIDNVGPIELQLPVFCVPVLWLNSKAIEHMTLGF